MTVRLAIVVGAVIHTERSARGLTQGELARLSGMHPMAVSKIERGVQKDVGIETLTRMAAALSSAGQSVQASGLLARAESWSAQFPRDGDSTLTGASLAAAVALSERRSQ